MFNKVIIVGNLTRDVELKYLPSGSATTTIGLASNRKYKKQDGEMAEETCFVDVKLFGRTAEIANQYLKKGSQILIDGRLSYETWNDASGQKRSKHTIIAESMQMLGKANAESQGVPQSNANYTSKQSVSETSQNVPEIDIGEDEIPF